MYNVSNGSLTIKGGKLCQSLIKIYYFFIFLILALYSDKLFKKNQQVWKIIFAVLGILTSITFLF